MTKDNNHKKKQKKRKNSDGSSADERERKYKALAQDMRSRIDRGESYIPPANRKELFPGRFEERNPGPPSEERRPWELPQNVSGLGREMDGFSPNQQKRFSAKSGKRNPAPFREERRLWEISKNVVGVRAHEMEGLSTKGSLRQAPERFPAEPQPELSLRQRQLLELEQQGQLPSDLLPSPHHEDFLGGIQIKGVANLAPVVHHQNRVPFLRHPQNQDSEEQQQTHQLPYQQNYSPTSSWDIEWTPTPKLDIMSPAIGMALRNARDRTSGSGPSNGNASRTNGARRSNGVKDEEDEIPLVDAPASDKSKIVVASQYLFQHQIEGAGMTEERDVAGRLIGIQLIEGVRKALRM